MSLVLAAYAAVAAATFNLNCSGLIELQDVAGKRVEPFTTTFRIDLNTKKWCEGPCSLTHDIVGFDDVVIHLQRDEALAGQAPSHARLDYVRVSGHYSEYRMSYPDPTHVYFFQREAQCTEAPFTGFTKGPGSN